MLKHVSKPEKSNILENYEVADLGTVLDEKSEAHKHFCEHYGQGFLKNLHAFGYNIGYRVGKWTARTADHARVELKAHQLVSDLEVRDNVLYDHGHPIAKIQDSATFKKGREVPIAVIKGINSDYGFVVANYTPGQRDQAIKHDYANRIADRMLDPKFNERVKNTAADQVKRIEEEVNDLPEIQIKDPESADRIKRQLMTNELTGEANEKAVLDKITNRAMQFKVDKSLGKVNGDFKLSGDEQKALLNIDRNFQLFDRKSFQPQQVKDHLDKQFKHVSKMAHPKTQEHSQEVSPRPTTIKPKVHQHKHEL